MKTSEFPWTKIARPESNLNTRIADVRSKWEYWWGKNDQGQALFLIPFMEHTGEKLRLPPLKSVNIDLVPVDGSQHALAYTLLDDEVSEQFFELCTKIMDHCEKHVENLEDLHPRAINRTWLWRRLLAGRGLKKMGLRGQMGLVSELAVLKDLIIPKLGIAAALEAWQGPLDESKDFTFGSVGIETKAISSRDRGKVRVSSVDQLSSENLDHLLLTVKILNTSPDGELSIKNMAETIENLVSVEGVDMVDKFNELLLAAGYDGFSDNDIYKFNEGDLRIYEVTDGFPRLVRPEVAAQIVMAKYSIQIDDCSGFIIRESRVGDYLDKYKE